MERAYGDVKHKPVLARAFETPVKQCKSASGQVIDTSLGDRYDSLANIRYAVFC
jgi:hypothetical protein